MCVLKISSRFVIFVVFFVSLNGVLAKRGCASFGHSCYGGHGKRSSQGFDSFSQDRFVDVDASNRQPSRDHEASGAEQFIDISPYDSVGKPSVDRFAKLLQKLAKSWEEQDQIQHRNNYQRVY